MVFKFSGCFVKEKNNYVSACFFKNSLPKSKYCSESRIRLFSCFLVVIGQFSPVYMTWPRLSETFSELHAAFGTTFRVTEAGSNLNAGKDF
jgi:hypothetical protein